MIAMQYSFVLPADYDMAIIDRRIREKGPALDGFPHLRFKAYLSARRQAGRPARADNLYAPFYLWDEPQGIDAFLGGPGFAAVTGDFGWPAVRTWIAWHAELGDALKGARYATREIMPIPRHSDLAALRAVAAGAAREATGDGALAALAAFDPTGWTQVRFRLWPDIPPPGAGTAQVYDVGYVALPAE